MMKVKPPKKALHFLRWFCREDYLEEIEGDLTEIFRKQFENSPRKAKWEFIWSVIRYFRPEFIKSFRNSHQTSTVMIGSYIKTSVRSISRNKLFSAINIVGLAISMSVGLLLIAFTHDLLSYDRFNEKGDRIYRITSHAAFRGEYSSTFATTSVKVGHLIKEKIPGVEAVTMVQTEFAADANVKGNSVPLKGYYAEPSLLQIFSLPMLKGDMTNALREPCSIVLTETAAKKVFGLEEAFGKTIQFKERDYQVTGILKDVPFFSHLQFESLVSYSTIAPQIDKDRDRLSWENVYQRNYVYVLLDKNTSADYIQVQIDAICAEENKANKEAQVYVTLLPLHDIMSGEELQNSIRPVMPKIVVWIIGGLALVVILSACFNYTNLSIALAMRRNKEIGLRKVIGAGRRQVRMQFLAEAVIVSLVALVLSFGLFLLLRPQFMTIAPELLKMVKLEVTVTMVLLFIAFAMVVGVVAGFLTGVFFARINIMNALRDVSSVKVFKGLSFRRALVVVQYTLTLIFITSTLIGYVQYKNILAFDLGFNTENILNIDLQGNNPEQLIHKLKAVPEVKGISQSKIVTSVGNAWGAFVKYNGSRDSSLVFTNFIDEHYLAVHDYHLIAGQNFITRPSTKAATSEIIVNEKTLRLFNIANGDAQKAVGEEVLLSSMQDAGKKLTIVGVIKDFHYGKLDEEIKPVAFTYLTPDRFLRSDKMDGLVNVRLDTRDPMETIAKIREVWKSVDPVHPFEAKFYDDSIEEAYSELSAMIKVIGFLSFISISIASLGLLGMVVFTTETRLREISIRKVLGATSGNLVLLLSRSFVLLLTTSALIALPVTYLFFEMAVLVRFPFHENIGMAELFGGLLAVFSIAFIMIGSQTIKASRSNPSEVLKSE